MSPRAAYRYLAFPLRGPALMLICTLSALLMLAGQGGLLGLPLAVIVVSWFFKYAFALLDATADGMREPPVLSYEMLNPVNETRPLLLTAVSIGVYMLTSFAATEWGASSAVAIRTAAALCAPAALAVLIVSKRVWHFANPVVLLRVAYRLGADYLLLLSIVGALVFGGAELLRIGAQPELPFGLNIMLRDALLLAVWMYSTLLLFALTGGAVFERRHALGFEPAFAPERLAQKSAREQAQALDHLIDRIFAEGRGGAVVNAWRSIEEHLQHSPDRAKALQALLHRAAQWPDARLANRLAQELIAQLLNSKRTGGALDVARARLRAHPHFEPLTPAHTQRLIELARAAGDRATARALGATLE